MKTTIRAVVRFESEEEVLLTIDGEFSEGDVLDCVQQLRPFESPMEVVYYDVVEEKA